ncbi:MAG: flavodoxin family protein [Gemmatimonadaceae bacterium]
MSAANRLLDPAGAKLKAIFLLGTLKTPAGEFSHTEVLCELVMEAFRRYNVQSEVVRLVEFNIKPGVESDMGSGDEWPGILKKLLAADIIIFATPIWWGNQSSLIQRVIERMDALNDELLETGKSELANKVGGMVITGAEDGAENIIGNLANFLIWNGVTLPPACSISYLGDYTGETKESLLKKFRDQKSTASMARTMTRNLVFFSRLLRENNIPQDDSGISQDIAPGAVGMRGDRA